MKDRNKEREMESEREITRGWEEKKRKKGGRGERGEKTLFGERKRLRKKKREWERERQK